MRLSEDPEDRGRDLPLRFSAFAQCDNSACQETATISGSGTENWVEDFPSPQLYCEFSPEYIYPSPDLFSIPVATPSNLRRAIQSAFVLSWGEYEACVNRIRTSVEMVLDSLPIPRTRPNHGGHESFLNLYERIENVDEKFPHIGAIKQHLQACRLLGNVGSHSNDVTKEDVFDALELLEAIVLVIYGEQARVTDLAESIVARHRK